ncbi:MAG: LD-carboxypeptidase, partial [Synechococcus sp.]
HWRLSGALQQLAGLGFGRFEGCEAPEDDARPGFSLEQVLRERSLDLGIPVVGELPFGHGQPNAALPLGRTVRLDGSSGTLSVL